jgi:hypothetical protein
MEWGEVMIHAPFTKPVKRGRPLTTGRFNTRAELEENVIDRYGRGWSARRIGIYAGITDRTVTSIILKNLGAKRT